MSRSLNLFVLFRFCFPNLEQVEEDIIWGCYKGCALHVVRLSPTISCLAAEIHGLQKPMVGAIHLEMHLQEPAGQTGSCSCGSGLQLPQRLLWQGLSALFLCCLSAGESWGWATTSLSLHGLLREVKKVWCQSKNNKNIMMCFGLY